MCWPCWSLVRFWYLGMKEKDALDTFLTVYFSFFKVSLIYNVPISALQQSDTDVHIYIYIYPLSHIIFHHVLTSWTVSQEIVYSSCALDIFNKLHLWVLLFLQILSIIWQKSISGFNSGETWKYISSEIFPIFKVTSTLMFGKKWSCT